MKKNEYESFDLIKMEKLVFLWKRIKDAMIFSKQAFPKIRVKEGKES